MEIGPITSLNGNKHLKSEKQTIDSTFIFATDTLDLPLFDEFSSSKFQTYSPDYNDPSVYSEIFYHLTDPVTLQPLNVELGFTNQPTFKRTYDLANGSFLDSVFNPTSVRVGELHLFPVNYEGLELYPPFYIIDTINDANTNLPDTVWLNNPEYLQDSARVFFQTVSDQNKIWIDNFAFHNYRFGLNPPSIGVVTFDGLDQDGNPYQFGSTSSNYADVLTSKAIRLGNYVANDPIYLSFLYQP